MSLQCLHHLAALLRRAAAHQPQGSGSGAWASILGQRLESRLHAGGQPLCSAYSPPASATTQQRSFSSAEATAASSQASSTRAVVQVVLLQDIIGLGRRGDVTVANPGWVRHHLFPRGEVAYATPESVKLFAMAEEERARLTSPEEQARTNLTKILRKLSRETVNLSRRKEAAPEGGEEAMVGKVTPFDILNAAAGQLGIQLHDSHFFMGEPITDFGTFKVPLNLRQQDDKQVELTVRVNPVSRIRHGSKSS